MIVNNAEFSVAILAAGQGRRFGYPKALMRSENEYLLLDLLKQVKSLNPLETIVVLGSGQNIIKPMLPSWSRVVVNQQWQRGMSGSIQLALKSTSLKSSGVLLMTCDQILIQTDHLKRITASLSEFNSRSACIASSYNGTFGIPCYIGVNHFALFDTLRGDHGAKSVLGSLNPTLVPMGEAFNDVDTPEDLIAMLKKR